MCTRANYLLAFIFVRNGFCNFTIMVTPFYNRVEDELKPYFLFFTDVKYSWLSVPFSEGDFKSVTVRQPSSSRAGTRDGQVVHVEPE